MEDWDRRATPGMVLVRGRDPDVEAPRTGDELSVTLPPTLPPLTTLLFRPSMELMVVVAPSGPSSGVEGFRAVANGMAVGVVIVLLSVSKWRSVAGVTTGFGGSVMALVVVLVRLIPVAEERCVGDNILSDFGTVAEGGGTLPPTAAVDVLGAEWLGELDVVVACLPPVVWEERDVVGTELIGDVMWVVVTGCFIAFLRSSSNVLRVFLTLAAALPLGDPTEIAAAAAGRERRAVFRDGDVAVVVAFPVGEDDVLVLTFFSPLATLFKGELEEVVVLLLLLFVPAVVVVVAVGGPTRLEEEEVALTAPGGRSRRSLIEDAGGRDEAADPGGDAAPLKELTLLVINAVLLEPLSIGTPEEIPDSLPSATTPLPPPPRVALLRRLSMATTTSSGNWQISFVGTQSTSRLRAYRGSNAAVIFCKRDEDHRADISPETTLSTLPEGRRCC